MPLLLFVIMPVLEMWILIEVGSQIGALNTVALVLFTAMIGVGLLRRQGFSAIARANQKMETGEMPVQEMIEGIFLAVGGALLLTPGFVTDAIGFCCLLPGVRQLLLGRILQRMVVSGQATFYTQSSSRPQNDRETTIIEGEFQRENDKRLK